MSGKSIVVGNWKMNPSTLTEAKSISQKIRRHAAKLVRTEVVICPPYIYISAIKPRKNAQNFDLGAQAVSIEQEGPHTGEVGAGMLKEAGVKYVIVGHSEARAQGDTDQIVSKRILAALQAGLIPIVCIGEKERDEENGSHFEFIKTEMKNSLAEISRKYAGRIILAYEPVWAIGASEPMTPDGIHEMTLFVRKVFSDIFGQEPAMKAAVLYGGAVNFRNAADIMKIGQVDGLLVGRESVNVAGFIELIKAVDTLP